MIKNETLQQFWECNNGECIRSSLFGVPIIYNKHKQDILFQIQCYPKGETKQMNNICVFRLELLKFPDNIKTLNVSYHVNISDVGRSFQYTVDFTKNINAYLCWDNKAFKYNNNNIDRNIESLIFKIVLSINMVVTQNGNSVIPTRVNKKQSNGNNNNNNNNNNNDVCSYIETNGHSKDDILNEIEKIKLNQKKNDKKMTELLNFMKVISKKLDGISFQNNNSYNNNNINSESKANEIELQSEIKFKEWFINEIGLYNEYYDIFLENGINNIETSLSLTDEHLQLMGIKKIGHRIKILNSIQKCKFQYQLLLGSLLIYPIKLQNTINSTNTNNINNNNNNNETKTDNDKPFQF